MSAPSPQLAGAPPAAVASSTHAPTRLVSLDALRGFDMFWILGADALVQVVAKTWPVPPLTFLGEQLDHKTWAGLTFYDLIFPLFLFIVGVSLVFSLTRLIEQHGRTEAVKRILRRTALLFLLGLFYNGGLSNAWPNLRLMGVLQRIAIAYGATGLLFCYLRPAAIWRIAVVLLGGYWALLTFVPIRDISLERRAVSERLGVARPELTAVQTLYRETTTSVTGRYEPGLNLTNHVDFEYLPGRKYDTYWDPEGLLSTLPAIATCILGVFAGLVLRANDRSSGEKLRTLVIAGIAALALGWAWHLQFPVVKKIWTSSFVLVAGGWSLLLLAAFYYVVDVRQWRRWCQPFVWIGMNPITLYVLTAVVSFDRIARRFAGGNVSAFLDTHVVKGCGDVVLASVALLLLLWLARFLYQRKIFLRV